MASIDRGLRFDFACDGGPAEGQPEMSVTYLGRVSRKAAEADARRRFEEWRRMGSALARQWSRDQVVVA